MRTRILIILAIALSLCACGPEQGKKGPAQPRVLETESVPLGALPRAAAPSRYRIALTIDPAKDSFSGHAEIDVTFAEKRRALFIHGNGLNVLAASVRLSAGHSITAHYTQVDKSGVARLIFVDQVPAGKATLVFDYEAPFGKSLSGLYKVVDRGDAYVFTQFEDISAREAFPSFDEPGFKTPFQISVTAPHTDRVIGNTPVQSALRADGGMMQTIFQWTRPLPTYLVALAVGPLDIVDGGEVPANQFRSRPIHLRGIAARGNGPRIRYALSLTPRIVTALEGYFQISYPFEKLDILAVPDFAAGAMENAGAITFRERLLLLDADAPIDQKRGTLMVQAHEITHQWFGDLVTPAWWDDIWLNESFANWMESKIAAEVLPAGQFDTETLRSGFDVMALDELPSARQIHQPVHGPDDIENAFDSITYDKGASVLSMFENFLGPEVFRRGIHAYLTKFAFRNATASDFLGTISATAAAQARSQPEDITIRIDRAGRFYWNNHPVADEGAVIDQLSHMTAGVSATQIASAFHSFIDQPGVPYLQFHLACDDAAASARVRQSIYRPIGAVPIARQWKVPACLAGQGDEKICRLIDRSASDLLLGTKCPQSLMPNDEGRGYYRFALERADWQALTKAAPEMDAADQISLLYNLDAGLRAGRVTADALFAAVRATAPSARWDTLDAVDKILHQLRISALAPGDLADYRNLVRANYMPRMSSVGLSARPGEQPGVTLTRERLVRLLVSEARDPDVLAALTKSAHSYLAGDKSALPPELIDDAMRAGLIVEGKPFADLLIQAFGNSNSEFFRRQLVYAFAGSDDPDIVRKLLALALTPRMRIGEIRYLYQYMGDEPVARATLWNWYKANYGALLARVSRNGMARAPGLLSTACDPGSRADLDAFFAQKTSELTGTQRKLALSDETIDRCIAFRQAKADEIAAALHAAVH